MTTRSAKAVLLSWARVVAASLCVAVVGCDSTTGSMVCAPGMTQACACPGGGKGAQTCTASGGAWGQCIGCSAGVDSGRPADADSSAAKPDAAEPHNRDLGKPDKNCAPDPTDPFKPGCQPDSRADVQPKPDAKSDMKLPPQPDSSGKPDSLAPTVWKKVACGVKHTCALTSSGAVKCWGQVPTGTPPSSPQAAIASGNDFACTLSALGLITCWGAVKAPPTGAFVAITAGGQHACALTTLGVVKCWNGGIWAPLPTPPGVFNEVSASWTAACGIRDDQSLYCWDDIGSCVGCGGSLPPLCCTLLFPPSGSFIHVATGTFYACAIRTDGALACWGNAISMGKPAAKNFKRLAVGKDFGCGVEATSGAVTCWSGQNGNINGQANPPPITAVEISAGDSHACSLSALGTITCWGDNSSGQTSVPPL